MSRIPWKSLREDGLNLPNSISHGRILAAPIAAFFLVITFESDAARWWMLAVFIVIALTDMVDGYIARKYDMKSEWGAFFDPIADKIMVTVVLVALCVAYYNDPLWWIIVAVTVFCVMREIVLAIQIGRANDEIQPPLLVGKHKTALQAVMLGVLIMPIQSYDWGLALTGLSVLLALIWTFISWIDYYREFVLHETRS